MENHHARKTEIFNQHASDDFYAFQWASAAASLGWRVVAVFPATAPSGWLCVWVEVPEGADRDEWDQAHRQANPDQYDDEDDEEETT